MKKEYFFLKGRRGKDRGRGREGKKSLLTEKKLTLLAYFPDLTFTEKELFFPNSLQSSK